MNESIENYRHPSVAIKKDHPHIGVRLAWAILKATDVKPIDLPVDEVFHHIETEDGAISVVTERHAPDYYFIKEMFADDDGLDYNTQPYLKLVVDDDK